MELVSEMLNHLPTEVWSNPNLKWLDPANGMGNFPITVFLRLMEGLKEQFPNEKERKQHILEEQLYMIDINEKNCFVTKQIFGNKYKLNIVCGDTLTTSTENEFKVKKFDIIMGNPPYQKENKKTSKARGGKNSNLYIDFMVWAYEHLSDNGYLVFIHPQAWRKIGSKYLKYFFDRHILYLKLNYGEKLFKNVSVKTDYYVVHNIPPQEISETTVDYEYEKKRHEVVVMANQLIQISFIPNILNPEIISILEKIASRGVKYKCIINSDCHKTRKHVQKGKDNKYKYPLYNTSGNPYEYFSSRPHKNQFDKKVILSNSGKLSPIYDGGIYGTTQHSMYILVDTEREGITIMNTMKSKLYKFLVDTCKWSNFTNENKLFDYLKYPKEMVSTDDDVNRYFGLTEDEIEIINGKETNDEVEDEIKNEIEDEVKEESHMCRAIKRDGVKCSHPAKYGGMFCGVHKKSRS